MFAKVIEIIEYAQSEIEAAEMVNGLKLQEGVWGARVIGGGSRKPWAAQGFMDLQDGMNLGSWLPDGMKVVIAPPAVMRMREVTQ